MTEVVPVFAEFFSKVAAESVTRMKSLAASDRAPYIKRQIPQLLEEREKVHKEFVNQGAQRFR